MSITKLSKGFSFYLKVLLVFALLLSVYGVSVTFAQEDVTDSDLNHIEGSQPGDAQALDIVSLADKGYHIDVATLEGTIHTWDFDPPSPDPVGIAYLATPGNLLISDSEVNEMPIYEGATLFESTLTGTLVFTGTTIPMSYEPTGLAYNPDNEHIFISDDVLDEVFDLDPGDDEIYGTGDDSYTSFDTATYGSDDPSGVGYDSDNEHLYVVDGVGREVYKFNPATGDMLSQFDLEQAGVVDPEGIEYDPACGTLLVSDNSDKVVEMTTDGFIIRLIDISEAPIIRPSGITLAPGSSNPAEMHLYIADRGLDNADDPNENDGEIYEFSYPVIDDCNLPPDVEAGPDQAITFPSETSVNLVPGASVTDDGLPDPPATVTTTWSLVSGTGPVGFGDASLVDTIATFSEPGIYVLRLTADDGRFVTYDEVTITAASETGVIIESQVNTSSDDAEEREFHYVTVTSHDLDLVYDASQDTTQTVGIRFNGIGLPKGATILHAYIQFQAFENTSGEITLTIEGEDIDDAPTFVANRRNITDRNTTSASVPWSPPTWNDNDAGFDQRTSNIAPVIQEIVDRSGWESCNSLAIIITGSGERIADSYDGNPLAAPLLHIYADSGTAPVNQGPCVNAGPDQAISLPAVANLDGTVIDDGLPDPPGSVNSTWSMTSGPGTVTFGDENAVDTTASFSVEGTYVLRLTANDGEQSNFDEMTVEVAPQNFPPVVDAGLDQTIVWPTNEATLDGTVGDDGLPSGVLTSSWSKVSGPGVVVFSQPDAAQTNATFSEMGTYVLRLTATDGELSSFDEVTVYVIENELPVVDAGLDQTVSLLTGAALKGTVTDDTLPTGVLTTTWTMESGPGTVTFADDSAVDTTASFSTAGTYVLRLTADDSDLTAYDETTIEVVVSLVYLPFVVKD